MKNRIMVKTHQKIACGPIAADAANWSMTMIAQTVNSVMSSPRMALRKPRSDVFRPIVSAVSMC